MSEQAFNSLTDARWCECKEQGGNARYSSGALTCDTCGWPRRPGSPRDTPVVVSMPERTPPDFDALGITDLCSRCGQPYDEHPHACGEDCIIGNPHAFRSQPLPGRAGMEPWIWPDGRFESWDKQVLARARERGYA